jgi:hypothetical protein
MEIRRTERGFRVVDSVSTCLDVETDGWTETDDAPPVTETLRTRIDGPDEADLTVSGRTRRLSFPNVLVQVVDLDDDSVLRFSANTTPQQPSTGRYLLKIDTSVRAYLRFDGTPEISRVGSERVDVTFPEPTAVSVGFEGSVDGPDGAVTVPETVRGVAAGFSTFGAAADVTTADRSWPSVRNHPPLLRFGDGREVSDSVREAGPDTGIELTVPAELEYLLVSVSLSYYLGAKITVAEGCDPRLDVNGRSLSLGSDSPVGTHDSVTRTDSDAVAAYASRCATLLRRVVYGDCLIREASPYGGSLGTADPARDLGLDSQSLYDAPIAERVTRYLDAPFENVRDSFPRWSVALSVDSRYDNARTLSRVAHTLPAVAPATGDTVTTRMATDHTHQRDTGLRADGDAAHVGPARSSEVYDERETPAVTRRVRPDHVWGRVHGWLADGIPVEGYDALAEGFQNRDRFRGATGDTPSVHVVLNGTDDYEELSRAVEHYRRQTARLDLDVSIQTNLSVAELARTFERETDLLHFVGHHERRGLECRDGYFSAETLSVSNARTFFLNACGSHPEGVTLVEKGSVAGCVTTRDVIDEMAAEVGVTMARLLAHGFTVADAMAEARRSVIVPSDYLVVGDGTHVVTQSDDLGSKRIGLTPLDEETAEQTRFRLTYDIDSPTHVGAESVGSLDGEDDGPYLFGKTREYEPSPEELREYLSVPGAPVRYDRELVGRDELLAELFD